MNYTTTSGEFIKYFIPIFNEEKNEANALDTKLLKVIYNDIYKAHRETLNHSCLKGVIKKITKPEPAKQPEIYNSKFFPTYIKKYIREV